MVGATSSDGFRVIDSSGIAVVVVPSGRGPAYSGRIR